MEDCHHLGESFIVQIGIKYINECYTGTSQEEYNTLVQALCAYIHNPCEKNDKYAKELFYSLVGSAVPLSKIKEIIEIPINFAYNNVEGQYAKKKTKPWQKIEDNRLLAAIYRYGINNWGLVSAFVGSGRTRSQCYQRWMRGLNPGISKDVWTFNEDIRLVELVCIYGDKSWTKVAQLLGCRSDVQCRYHYHQLKRDMPNVVAEFSKGKSAFPCSDQSVVTIRSPFTKKHNERFSSPDIQIPSIFIETLRSPSVEVVKPPNTPLRKFNTEPQKHATVSLRRTMLPIFNDEKVHPVDDVDDDKNLDKFLTHFV